MILRTCLLTEHDCFRAGGLLRPRGVMIHSTGANNPNLRRYLAPDDGLLGTPSSRHWNRSGLDMCAHAFIGKLADGTVAAYQTLPWTVRGWHCGRGALGSANDTHIAMEICEDGLDDPVYFQSAYGAAAELTARLCAQFGLDPMADGVVITHAEGYRRGVASNHADVLHWFPRFGKTMDDFRADVARRMKKEDEPVTQEQFDAMMERWLARRGQLPAAGWAAPIIRSAREAGLTDGTRPQALATRQEVMAMVLAAQN